MRVLHDPVIDPSSLSSLDRERLVAELFAVHAEIFDGVDVSAFRAYVIEAEGADTRIQVFRDSEGTAIGYCSMHAYLRRVGGEQTLIVRGGVGILRQWRGAAPHIRFGLTQTLRLWREHRGIPMFGMACPVHPSLYWGVTRRARRSWPRPGTPTPPEIRAFMVELAEAFGLPPVEGADSLVRRVGWITRDNASDRRFWMNNDAPAVRYYRELNPYYARGDGLMLLVPMTLKDIAVAGWRNALRQLSSTSRGARELLSTPWTSPEPDRT